MTQLARTLAFSVVVSLFLGVVGAFGSAAAPLAGRIVFFLIVGLGCALPTFAGVIVAGRIGAFQTRPLLRHAAIGLWLTPTIGFWVWVCVGYVAFGGPRLKDLPLYAGYSAVMCAFMSLLSWAIFRPRSAPQQPAPPEGAASFLERLPLNLRGSELYAVQAEDHYLRLHTSKGSALILMRLSDALAELKDAKGARTHRSWWVAKDAVVDLARPGGRVVLKLKNGAAAPVSRAHLRGLRADGWF